MDDDMQKCNENLVKFVGEVDTALKKYLKGGHINLATAVGAIENFKFYIIDLAKNLQKGEELKWRKLPPVNYIG